VVNSDVPPVSRTATSIAWSHGRAEATGAASRWLHQRRGTTSAESEGIGKRCRVSRSRTFSTTTLALTRPRDSPLADPDCGHPRPQSQEPHRGRPERPAPPNRRGGPIGINQHGPAPGGGAPASAARAHVPRRPCGQPPGDGADKKCNRLLGNRHAGRRPSPRAGISAVIRRIPAVEASCEHPQAAHGPRTAFEPQPFGRIRCCHSGVFPPNNWRKPPRFPRTLGRFSSATTCPTGGRDLCRAYVVNTH
jgi:hypothetical protein